MIQSLNHDSNTFHSMESIAGKNNEQNTMPLNEPINTRDANGNFLAPNITIEQSQPNNSNTGKILTIYVGPFITSVNSDEIVAHIWNKTGINDSKFIHCQETCWPKDIKRKTFVSFEISTFSMSVYNLINNNDIWGPNQSAHPFNNISMKNKPRNNNDHNVQRFNNNYPWQKDNRSRQNSPLTLFITSFIIIISIMIIGIC